MKLLLTKYVNTTQTIIIVPLTLSPLCPSLLVRLTVYIVNLCTFYSYMIIGKLTVFCFTVSGVQLPQSTSGQFHYLHTVFSSPFRLKVGNILTKDGPLRITVSDLAQSELSLTAFKDWVAVSDLDQSELRVLCELVGTLNVWVSINIPINQSPCSKWRTKKDSLQSFFFPRLNY